MNANANKTRIGLGLLVLSVSIGAAIAACGGDEKKGPETPGTSSGAPTSTASSLPSASAATSAATPTPSASASTPAASASAPPPPAPKGKFNSFAVNAQSGKVDKVGNKDGAFKADGVKDLVFDVELEGPANAILLVSTDGSGQPNGEFNADTFVGDQQLPSELAANLNQGKFTAGVAVYEGDKLLNGKDGGLPMLADGKHKLTLYISSKDAPKGSYKALATFDNKSITASSPVAVK